MQARQGRNGGERDTVKGEHGRGSGRETMVPGFGRVRRLFYAILTAGAAGVLVFAGFLAYAAFTLPMSPAAATDLPSSAVTYAADTGQPFAVRGVFHGDPIRADKLPPYLARAVVAI